MPRLSLVISIALLASAWDCEVLAAPPVARINCDGDVDLVPAEPGLLRLAAVYCQKVPLRWSAHLISPDAKFIAYYNGSQLSVAPLNERDNWTTYPAELGAFARFSASLHAPLAFTWASDSSGVWTATQQRDRPGGAFTKSAMQPAMTVEDGRLHLLPPFRHYAGPLDGLLWAGSGGLALAQFGTRGQYYLPKHDDPTPAFGIVDAKRGAILDTLAFDDIEILKSRERGRTAPYLWISNAVAILLPNGKVRALLDVSTWIVWTQGEAPRVLADPYSREPKGKLAITPDGSRVLVGRWLLDCPQERDSGKGVECNLPRPPFEDVIAALHDLETGRQIWSLRATFYGLHEFPTSAISDDGRYALIGLPPSAQTRPDSNISMNPFSVPRPQKAPRTIALVSMAEGQIVQTLPALDGYSMGFARGGQMVWTHNDGVTAIYDLHASAQ